ncbi:MAG TPA: TlpA disulfide reductase family protein [bacterium]|nr:TlpA disulfide reductase family protein [bacterium]
MRYLIILLIGILLSAGCATAGTGGEKSTENPEKTGKTANSAPSGNFTLDLEKIDGSSFSFSEIKGRKHLLVSFWATWCEPCKAELLKLTEIYPEFSDNFEFVAVSIDTEDMMDKVNQFSVENSIPFPVLVDPAGNTVSKLIPGGDTVPYLIIVNKNGEIVSKHSGYKSGDEESLKKELVELLSK